MQRTHRDHAANPYPVGIFPWRSGCTILPAASDRGVRMAEWYVFHNGTESGPFSDDAFLEFVRDKNPATVQIWREGLAGWVLAKTIPTLAAAMKPAAPAPVTKPKSGPNSASQSGFKSEPKAGTIPWPSVTAQDRAVTDNGAAPSDRLASIAVSVDDRFPDAGAD
ncbi:unnamed protein product, partial [marine sediment metagenome]